MDKRDTINKYYNDSKSFYVYLLSRLYGEPKPKEYLTVDNFSVGALLGTASTILLYVKEDIVDKRKVNGKTSHVSNIVFSELEKSVENIATKDENGYLLGGKRFANASLVVAFVRNVMAHGLYMIDYKHNKIIIKDEDGTILIGINDFIKFVMNGTVSKVDGLFDNQKRKCRVINENLQPNRMKPLSNARELENMIKNFSVLDFIAKKKDGNYIPYNVSVEISETFSKVSGIDDLKELVKLKNKYSSGYDISWTYRKVNKMDAHEMAQSIFSSLPNMDYLKQAYAVALAVNDKYIDSSSERRYLIGGGVNLWTLGMINKHRTVDDEIIDSEFTESKPFLCDHNNLGMAAISMFNALFLYGLDDIYKDNRDGLDFSRLDLSKIQVRDNPVDYSILQGIAKELSIKEKAIDKIDNNISKQRSCLNNLMALGNTQKIEKISELLDELDKKRMILEKDANMLADKYIDMCTYYTNNQDYLYNMGVITGIRNAIAHGNYRIERGNGSFLDAVIIFDDIYEGVNTFYAEVKIGDFVNMMDDSVPVIRQFLNDSEGKKRSLIN